MNWAVLCFMFYSKHISGLHTSIWPWKGLFVWDCRWHWCTSRHSLSPLTQANWPHTSWYQFILLGPTRHMDVSSLSAAIGQKVGSLWDRTGGSDVELLTTIPAPCYSIKVCSMLQISIPMCQQLLIRDQLEIRSDNQCIVFIFSQSPPTATLIPPSFWLKNWKFSNICRFEDNLQSNIYFILMILNQYNTIILMFLILTFVTCFSGTEFSGKRSRISNQQFFVHC